MYLLIMVFLNYNIDKKIYKFNKNSMKKSNINLSDELIGKLDEINKFISKK